MGGRQHARRPEAQRPRPDTCGRGDHDAGIRSAGGQPMTTHESESTSFLYPFIESEETDAASLLDDLFGSARSKAAESARLHRESLDEYAPGLTAAASAMAERSLRGGRLYTLGNGGSSTAAA